MPDGVSVRLSNSSSVSIAWTPTNRAADYTVSVIGSTDGPFTCQSKATSCQVNGLSCGSSYQVTSIASTTAGLSMPSYSVSFQTGKFSMVLLIFGANESSLILIKSLKKQLVILAAFVHLKKGFILVCASF